MLNNSQQSQNRSQPEVDLVDLEAEHDGNDDNLPLATLGTLCFFVCFYLTSL